MWDASDRQCDRRAVEARMRSKSPVAFLWDTSRRAAMVSNASGVSTVIEAIVSSPILDRVHCFWMCSGSRSCSSVHTCRRPLALLPRAAARISGHSAAKRCQKPSKLMDGAPSRRASRNSSIEISPEPSWSTMRNSSLASISQKPMHTRIVTNLLRLRRTAASPMSSWKALAMDECRATRRSRKSSSKTSRGMFVRASRNSSSVSCPLPSVSMIPNRWLAW
mmetsp:Transcript_7700/g.21599  ORF Transcript_7700/g.21599 Transcript_7700/m.21599 type:complete len:221 (+) Transcript_7700:105-767(+)